MEVNLNILINFIVYSYTLILLIISVTSAIYKPALGVISCLGLGAFFLDKNKEIFLKFFISPKIFFRKHTLVAGGHRAYFFAFLIAFFANVIMILFRAI